ncbi:MAG: acyltransferase [Holosporaceae bacterium]|jgi:peptidoglycan/LPS O-acetylase OafA/YrhL|nr:acyltransferase [Holosporaceae bacterium]
MKKFEDIERLRGFACILVLIQHIAWVCPLRFTYNVVPFHLLVGSGGVHIFFAISGFVVTLSLKDKINEIRDELFLNRLFSAKELLLTFYKKRFFRIFPMALFAIFSLAVFLNFTEENLAWLPSLLRTPSEVFFGVYNDAIQLFQEKEKIHNVGFGSLWTLAVESQFYFLWPLALLLCKNDNARAIVCFSLGSLLVFVAQPALNSFLGYKYYYIYTQTAGLFWGSFLAYLYASKDSSIKMNGKVANLITAVLAMTVWFYPNAYSFENRTFYFDTVVDCASILLVAFAVFVEGSFKLPILGRVFDFLGSRSFSFYIIQLPLANMIVWYTNSIYFPKESFY